jgi:prolyl-tRNA synthetase
MGTIAECLSDEDGLVWPEEVAPYRVHLVSLVQKAPEVERCDAVYDGLRQRGVEVLYDDRAEVQPGEKLADADLIGLPHRLVVSRRTLGENGAEWKKRASTERVVVPIEKVIDLVTA